MSVEINNGIDYQIWNIKSIYTYTYMYDRLYEFGEASSKVLI